MILDADGHYITEFGERGNGRGQFNGVHGLAVGPEGQIFVADRDNQRVQVFNETDPRRGVVSPEHRADRGMGCLRHLLLVM